MRTQKSTRGLLSEAMGMSPLHETDRNWNRCLYFLKSNVTSSKQMKVGLARTGPGPSPWALTQLWARGKLGSTKPGPDLGLCQRSFLQVQLSWFSPTYSLAWNRHWPNGPELKILYTQWLPEPKVHLLLKARTRNFQPRSISTIKSKPSQVGFTFDWSQKKLVGIRFNDLLLFARLSLLMTSPLSTQMWRHRCQIK